MNTFLLAVDPGSSGGLSVLRHDGITDATSMPDTPKDVCDWITAKQMEAAQNGCRIKCFIEKVGGYAGGPGQPGSAMWKFGFGVGTIHGFLIALGIPFETVTPQKWQKSLSLGIAGLERGNYKGLSPSELRLEKKRVSQTNNRLKIAWKNKLKAFAQNLNPQLKVTLATSDALCILEYGRRQERLSVVANQELQITPLS